MADDPNLIALTVDVVAAFVGQNNIRPEDIPGFIASTHAAISALGAPAAGADQAAQPEFTPAVSARKSLASKDHILSMIDGKPYKTLRRHLSTHGLTPEDYRARYRLPASYPMVSESYSQTRREMAKKIGLGRKVGAKTAPASAAPAAATSPAPKKAAAATRAAAKSATKPAGKSASSPAAKSTPPSAAKPAAKPAGRKPGRPAAQSAPEKG